MRASDKALDLIEGFEGLACKPYLCPASKLTIGYGRVIRPNEHFDILTQPEAETLLRKDLEPIESLLANSLKHPITQNQFDALCSFIYNLGFSAFNHSTLKEMLDDGNIQGAADEFLKWDKYTNPKTGKKEPLAGLTNRRKAERELFLTQE